MNNQDLRKRLFYFGQIILLLLGVFFYQMGAGNDI